MATGRHVLVTGAAGGIGSALAGVFAERSPGCRLSLVDRDEAAARTVAATLGPSAEARAWDLALPDRLPPLWDRLTAERGPVDVLVNCAGIMEMRSFAGTPWSLGELLLQVDLVSPLRLMSLAVGPMVERGSGIVINVSSMAGRLPLRGCAYYGAAKAGLSMASEIARVELEPRGVQVITVYPGPVATALERRARAQVQRTLFSTAVPTGSAGELASLVHDACEQRKARVVYPPFYRVAEHAGSFAGWITARLSPEALE